jgi:hypothetical protein
MEIIENQIIAKISKGSNMDQIYLPKNRVGMESGSYVSINLLTTQQKLPNLKPFLYGVSNIEPIKIEIITKLFSIIYPKIKEENLIITGSFLEPGFSFDDIDVLILNKNVDAKAIEQEIIRKIGVRPHLILLTKEELLEGLASDPLYQTMISKCISRKRLIFKFQPKINAKLLDFNLLKSKTLIDNFETLNGKEKYYLTFNLISIELFLKYGKISKNLVEKSIKEIFNIKNIREIKENLVNRDFLKKYNNEYEKTFNLIMRKLKNESK